MNSASTRAFAVHLTEDELLAALDGLYAYERAMKTDPRTLGVLPQAKQSIDSARAKVNAAFTQAFTENRIGNRQSCRCEHTSNVVTQRVTISSAAVLNELRGVDYLKPTEVSWQLTGRKLGVPFKGPDGNWYIRASVSRPEVCGIPAPPGGNPAGYRYNAVTNTWSRA